VLCLDKEWKEMHEALSGDTVVVHKNVLEYFSKGIKKCDKMMRRYREEINDLEEENRILKEKIHSWGV
jgi:hypothetical protein